MMDTISLKKYIFENGKIEYVLEQIGCHHIKYHQNKEFYSCANHDGDNQTAVNVKNNQYLNVTNWTRQDMFGEGSDIITLVQYNKKCSFIEAVKYLHNLLGLEYKWQKLSKKKEEEKFDPLYVFKRIKQHRTSVNVEDIHVLDEDVLDEYVPLLHIDWLREGITPRTAKKFNLSYSYKRKRVVIPIYYWLTKELVGFNMRTTIPNHEEFGLSKYWLTPTYQKSNNIYGLAQNYDSIVSKKIVTVFEGEKSTLKRDSLFDDTCVSLQGKTMSDEQARILIGLNVEVVVCLDKDVDVNEVRFICEKFYNIRPVSYVYDKWGLLKDKQSPADASNKVYQFLFKHRIKYDEQEHSLFMKSLNKK